MASEATASVVTASVVTVSGGDGVGGDGVGGDGVGGDGVGGDVVGGGGEVVTGGECVAGGDSTLPLRLRVDSGGAWKSRPSAVAQFVKTRKSALRLAWPPPRKG
jgi:hypothetical protein